MWWISFAGRCNNVYKKYIKRILDLIFSLVALPFLVVITLVVAVLIFVDDKGPVFYISDRIGKDGKLFKMIKFRSMKVNSPDIRLEDGSTYNGEDDPRVTRMGKFLRVTSIDELPQIFNILVGNMSLIGPRPDPPDWLERYPENVKEFLSVRPGISGYSQAYYRNSADADKKMENDLYYALNCTFSMDVKVFFKTIASILKRENTYKDTINEEKARCEVELLSNSIIGDSTK